jgi:hypothetical protein
MQHALIRLPSFEQNKSAPEAQKSAKEEVTYQLDLFYLIIISLTSIPKKLTPPVHL